MLARIVTADVIVGINPTIDNDNDDNDDDDNDIIMMIPIFPNGASRRSLTLNEL